MTNPGSAYRHNVGGASVVVELPGQVPTVIRGRRAERAAVVIVVRWSAAREPHVYGCRMWPSDADREAARLLLPSRRNHGNPAAEAYVLPIVEKLPPGT